MFSALMPIAVAFVAVTGSGPFEASTPLDGAVLHILEPSMRLTASMLASGSIAARRESSSGTDLDTALEDSSRDEPGLPRVQRRSTRDTAGAPALARPYRAEQDARQEPAEVGHEASRTHVGPWIGLGASAVLGVVGSVFVSRTSDALAQDPTKSILALSTTTTIPNTSLIRQQEHDVFFNGMLATVFISGAVAVLVTSVLMLLD